MTSSTLQPIGNVIIAHLRRNKVSPDQLCTMISQVGAVFNTLDSSPVPQEPPVPVVPVSRSIHKDYLVCLEDGLRFKTLKRHLMAKYGLTPDQYRKRWGLPPDYPMTAHTYSAARSGIAKDSGLGRGGWARVRLVG